MKGRNVVTLKERISSIQSYDEYLKLLLSLSAENVTLEFDEIWNLALLDKWDGEKAIASFLLVSLDISASKSIRELLGNLMDSPWDLSNQVLPFYLVTQFGKSNVLETIEEMTAKLPEGQQKTRINGVAYWARMPSASLVESLHYFEWKEVIEQNRTA